MPSLRVRSGAFGAVLLLLLLAPAVAAQGNVSTQGFGYPSGDLSARAAAMGGGTADVDAESATNPAALAGWGGPGVYAQYSPEFRTVSANGQSSSTMTARFPLFAGALPIGPRAAFGISLSTLLDRSWETSRSGYDHHGADSTQFTETFTSGGGIDDIRFSGAFAVLHNLWIGAGADVFSGQNRLSIERTSTDSLVATFSQSSVLSYSGVGASGGVLWQPIPVLAIGVSGRLGGELKSFRNDTVLTRASAPKRLGGSVSLSVAPGFVVAGRVDWEGWSAMNGLGQPGTVATNTMDYGGGFDLRGPTVLGTSMYIRGGYRHRTLPWVLDATKVVENTLSAGVGFPVSRGRSRVDVTVRHADRGSVEGVSEHAWIVDFGLMVRP